MMSVYDVPSTTPTGRCGILSVMEPIFSSVSSRLSYPCWRSRAVKPYKRRCWTRTRLNDQGCHVT